MTSNRQFTLARRPHGLPVAEEFALVESPIPLPGPGETLVRNLYVSLDPAIRGWLDDKPSYMPPIALGAPVRASTIGRIAASNNPDFAVGDWAMGLNAIEDYSIGQGGFMMKIDPTVVPSVTSYMSAMGGTGLTAYFGLLFVGKPQPGETVLVSGAAGAVGSLVGQIAKIKGCRAIGIAGGAAKCRRLIEEYGFDAAIDYRGKSVTVLAAEIAAAAPGGVDVVFENVGGDVLDASLLSLNHGARIVLCGLISEYNSTAGSIGARNIFELVVKSATMAGFIATDFMAHFSEAYAALGQWLAEGRLKSREHIDEGIENAFPAFLRLFEGSNQGKMILKIADE
jgi:NADPH-dependent curcumin reductase CurA